MARAILGLIKGFIVGGGLGLALLYLNWNSPVPAYLACALVGALVGLICGRAPWRAETIWTPILKALVGLIIGSGLCALGLHLLPDLTLFSLPLHGVAHPVSLRQAPFLATAIGVLYGLFVEVDDGATGKEEQRQKQLQKSSRRAALPPKE